MQGYAFQTHDEDEDVDTVTESEQSQSARRSYAPWTQTSRPLPAELTEATPQQPSAMYTGLGAGPDSASVPGPAADRGPEQHTHTSPAAGALPAAEIGPVQAGPLALYPAFALVDPQHRWQRIHKWANHDSHVAAALVSSATDAGSQLANAGDWEAATVISHAQEVRSVSASLLELERQRAHNSVPPSPAQPPPRIITPKLPDIPRPPPKARDSVTERASRHSAGSAVLTGAAEPHGNARGPGLATSVEQLLALLETVPSAAATAAAATAAAAARDSRQRPPAPLPAALRPHTAALTSAAASEALPVREPLRTVTNQAARYAADSRQKLRASKQDTVLTQAASEVLSQSTHQPGLSNSQDLLTGVLQSLHQSSAADRERAQLRETSLEAALSSERALVARLQAQLATELARSAAAATAESQARDAEQQAKKALESERRKSQDLRQRLTTEADRAATQLDSLTAKCTSLDAKLQQEKDAMTRAQRKLAAVTKTASQLQQELQQSETTRRETAAKLDTAASQVASMRGELSQLRAHLASREQQLVEHWQEVEDTQLAKLQAQLDSSQDECRRQQRVLAALSTPLVSLAQCLQAQPLAAALHLRPEHLSAFSASADQHAALVARVMRIAEAAAVPDESAAADVAALATRVRELLSAVQSACLRAERAEAAAVSEYDAHVTELSAQLQELQIQKDKQAQECAAREAGLTQALKTATQRVEELMTENEALTGQVAATQAAASAATQTAIQKLQTETAQAAERAAELSQDVDRWRTRATEAEYTLRDTQRQLAQTQTLVEAKEARLVELRDAVVKAQADAAQAHAALTQSASSGQAALGDLTAQLATSTAALTAAEAAQAQLEQRLAASQAEVARLNERLRADQASLTAQLLAAETHAADTQQLSASLLSVLRSFASQLSTTLTAADSSSSTCSRVAAAQAVSQQLQLLAQANDDALNHDTVTACLASVTEWVTGLVAEQREAEQACQHMRTCQELVHNLTAAVSDATASLYELGGATAAVSDKAHVTFSTEAVSSGSATVGVAQGVCASLEAGMGQAQALKDALAAHKDRWAERSADVAQLKLRIAQLAKAVEAEKAAARQSLANEQSLRQAQEAQHTAALAAAEQRMTVAQQDARALQALLVVLAHQKTEADTRAAQSAAALDAMRQAARVTGTELEAARLQLQSLQQSYADTQVVAKRAAKQCQVATFRYTLVKRTRANSHAATRQLRLAVKRLQQGAKQRVTAVQAAEAALQQEKTKSATSAASLQALQSKLARAETLVTKLEERRTSLEADKRALADKLAAVSAKATSLEQTRTAVQKSEQALKQEHQRSLRAAHQRCAAAEARAATLLEALEGAERALRESQANSSKLLQLAAHQTHKPKTPENPPCTALQDLSLSQAADSIAQPAQQSELSAQTPRPQAHQSDENNARAVTPGAASDGSVPAAASAGLRAALAHYRSEVARLTEALQQAELETAEARAAQQTAQIRCQELESDVHGLQARVAAAVAAAQHEVTSLRSESESRAAEYEALASAHSALEVEVAVVRRERAAAVDRVAAAEQALAAADEALRRHAHQCTQLEIVVSSQDEELQQLRGELEQLRMAAVHTIDIPTKSADAEAAEQRAASAERAAVDLQSQVSSLADELQSARRQVDALTSQQRALQDRLHDVNAALAATQEQLASEQQRGAELQGTVRRLERENRELEASMESLAAEQEARDAQWGQEVRQAEEAGQQKEQALQAALEESRVQREQQSAQVAVLKRQVEQLQHQLDQAACELQACQLEHCALQLEHEAMQITGAGVEQVAAGLTDAGERSLAERAQELEQARATMRLLEERLREAGAREASYSLEVEAAREEVASLTEALGETRAHNSQLTSELEGVLQKLMVLQTTQQAMLEEDMDESESTMTGTTGRTQRVEPGHQDGVDAAAILADNQALMQRLQKTHGKLKVAKARIAQLEASLQWANQGQVPVDSRDSDTQQQDCDVRVAEGQKTAPDSTVHAYQVALKAAQEEAAFAMAQFAASQQQLEALSQRVQQGSGGKDPRQASLLAAIAAAQSDDGSRDQQASEQHTGQDSEPEYDIKAILQLIRNQHREIRTLQAALSSSHTKRAQDVKQAAHVAEELAGAQKQIRELESLAETMRHQLLQVQAQSASMRDNLRNPSPLDPVEEPTDMPTSPSSHIQTACFEAQAHWAHALRAADDTAGAWRDATAALAARVAQLEAAVRTADCDIEYWYQNTTQLQDKADAFQSRAEQAEAALTSLQRHARQQVSSVEQQAVAAAARTEALSKQLSATQDRLGELEGRYDQQAAELQVAQARARQAEERLTRVTQELERSEVSARDLTEAKNTLANQLSQLKREMSGLLAAAAQHTDLPPMSDQESVTGSDAPGAGGDAGEVHRLTRTLRSVLNAMAEGSHVTSAVHQQLSKANEALQQRNADIAALNARIRSQAAKITEQAAALASARELHTACETRLQRKEQELRTVEAEISRQLEDYAKLRARLLRHEQDSSRLSSGQEAMARKCDELHAALAAKQADCAAAQAQCAQQQEQLNQLRSQLLDAKERIRAFDSTRQQREQSEQHTDRLVRDLQGELEASQQAVSVLKTQLEKKMGEVRELHSMLKSWEAMRLGKDAQISALMERCKRHEEDAQEKTRTVEALRKKLSLLGRATQDSHMGGVHDSLSLSLSNVGSPRGGGGGGSVIRVAQHGGLHGGVRSTGSGSPTSVTSHAASTTHPHRW